MGVEKRKTTGEFITEAVAIHNNYYDYSKVVYLNRNKKVTIICPIHGEFEQTPNGHQKGYGCYKCGRIKCKKTTEEFIIDAKKVHGDKYDYSKTKYIDAFTDIVITCPKHGDFKQRPSNHLNNCDCKQCSLEDVAKQFSDDTETFITKAKQTHGDKFDYSKVKYTNSVTNITIICSKHGDFEQLPSNHISGNGCPICMSSKGEELILNWLRLNNIKFIRQHRFKNCRDIRPLPFDFYLPDYNTCIEYQGRQHYEIIEIWGGVKGLADRKRKDIIKHNYCVTENIKLISIKHNENPLEKLNPILL
jgi:hypothetical protein